MIDRMNAWRLVCAQCAAVAPPEARGWKAELAVGDEDAEDVEAMAIYCPGCAAREFDGP